MHSRWLQSSTRDADRIAIKHAADTVLSKKLSILSNKKSDKDSRICIAVLVAMDVMVG